MALKTLKPQSLDRPVSSPPFWATGLTVFDVFGEIVLFSIRSLAAIPRALRYRGEIWWYAAFLAIWIVQRYQIGLVSNGVYFSYFWRYTNVTDFSYSLIKAIVFAFLVICVGVYYGYHVRGGAVGIGRAVAKTMAVSLVMTVVTNAILTQVFWGQNPNLPIPS